MIAKLLPVEYVCEGIEKLPKIGIILFITTTADISPALYNLDADWVAVIYVIPAPTIFNVDPDTVTIDVFADAYVKLPLEFDVGGLTEKDPFTE